MNPAIERKAKPIYDTLNRGDYKGGLKLCNQALSKYPKNNLFTILKALAFDRLGNAIDALGLVDTIIASKKLDDEDVLGHTANLLKSHGENEKLLKLYQTAYDAQPTNLGLLQEVFLAHLRLGQVMEQQQLAMKLAKSMPCEMLTFWVVCSMLTQAERARAGDKSVKMTQEMLLRLAAGLIDKHVQKEGGVSYEALLVYLDILQAQGRLDECTKLLEGPSGEQGVQIPHLLLRLKAQTALAQRDVEAAKQHLMEGLRAINPDDWAGYMLLFACYLPSTALPLQQAADGLVGVCGGFGSLEALLQDEEHWKALQPPTGASEQSLHEACADLETFLKTLIEQVEAGRFESNQAGLLRGPYLAQVELAYRRFRLRIGGAAALASAMLAYFKRFRGKLVVPQDLRKYAMCLPREAAVWLVAALADERQSLATEAHGDAKWTLKQIQVTSACLRLERCLGRPAYTSAAAAVEQSRVCAGLFSEWRGTMAGCDEREICVGEQAAEHAASALVAAFKMSRNTANLVQAVVLCTVAARQRPFSASLRLSLAGLQWLLGDADACLAEFHALSPRQVQLDTLSHHVLPAVAQSGASQLERFLRTVQRVQDDFEGAMLDALTECYTNATFSKVPEFLEFQRTVLSSRTFLECRSEHALLLLHQATTQGLAVTTKLAQAAESIQQRVQGVVADTFDALAPHNDLIVWIRVCSANEDLSQLPEWRPPVWCTSTNAALEWWEAATTDQAGSDVEGATVPWWQVQSGSASAPKSHEATAWREARAQALAFRVAQVPLTAALLLKHTPGNASTARFKKLLPEGEGVQQLLGTMCAACEVTGVSLSEWHEGRDWSVVRSYLHNETGRVASSSLEAPADLWSPSQLIMYLTVSIFAFGVDLHDLLASCERLSSKDRSGTPQPSSGGEQNDLEDAGLQAPEHRKTRLQQTTVMICDMIGMLTILVQRELVGDDEAAAAAEDRHNIQLVDGVAFHTLQLLSQHCIPLLAALCVVYSQSFRQLTAKSGGESSCGATVAAPLRSIRDVGEVLKRVCSDLAEGVEDCRFVRNCKDAGSTMMLGVPHKGWRALVAMADEQQVGQALDAIAKRHLEVLTAAAKQLSQCGKMCSSVERSLASDAR